MFNCRRFTVSFSAGMLALLLIDAKAHAAKSEVTIEYIAHACFRLTSPNGDQFLVDPFGSREWIGYDYPVGIEAHAVLITHPHYDHDGGVSRGHNSPWPEATRVLREPGSYQHGDVEILGVTGKHADPYGKEFGQSNTIWLLQVAGLRIVHIGDNGPILEAAAAQVGDVDILMMPIDSEYHILKEREIQAILAQLTPSLVIPMHYRLGDLEIDHDSPSDLGGIDGWLESRSNVRRLGTHQLKISVDGLPDNQEILVFEHSPLVKKSERQ